MKSSIDGKPSNQDGRKHGITRQPLGLVRRQIRESKTGCRERIEGCDSISFPVNRDEAIAEPAAYILSHMLAKIFVERLHAASEFTAVVRRTENFEPEAETHLPPNNF